MNNINLKVKNELTNRNVINDLKEIKNNEVNSILLSLLIKYSNCLKEIYHENHGNLELNEKNIQRLQLIENRLFQITRSSAEVILIQETLIEIRRVISQSITKPNKIQLLQTKEEELKGSITTNETSEGEDEQIIISSDKYQQQKEEQQQSSSINICNTTTSSTSTLPTVYFPQISQISPIPNTQHQKYSKKQIKKPSISRSSSTSDLDYHSRHHNELSWHMDSTYPYHHSDDEFIPSSTFSSSSSLCLLRNSPRFFERVDEKDYEKNIHNHKNEIYDKESIEDRSIDEDRSDDEKDKTERGKRSKRLNKSATTQLTQWLVDHLDKPFPSHEEKYQIASSLHLTPQQVGNWMTNMRKRHVYPILSGKKYPKTTLDYIILDRQCQNNMLKLSHSKDNQEKSDQNQNNHQDKKIFQINHQNLNQKERVELFRSISTSSSSSSLQDMEKGLNYTPSSSLSSLSSPPPSLCYVNSHLNSNTNSNTNTPFTITKHEIEERETSQLLTDQQPLSSLSKLKLKLINNTQEEYVEERGKKRKLDENEIDSESNNSFKKNSNTSSIPTKITHRKRSSSEDWFELLSNLTTNITSTEISQQNNDELLNETHQNKKNEFISLLTGEELKDIVWLNDDLWEEV